LRARPRVDVVVDSVAGEDPLMGLGGFLWEADLKPADAMFVACRGCQLLPAW
jgi:hypothetical protein